LEELPQIRLEGHVGSRLPPACRARFEQYPRRHLTRPAEPLLMREAVAATEPADRAPLFPDELHRRVFADGVAQSFEFAVDTVRAQGGIEGQRIKEQVESSEKRSIRFQPFDRLVPPLKMTLSLDIAAMMRSVSVT